MTSLNEAFAVDQYLYFRDVEMIAYSTPIKTITLLGELLSRNDALKLPIYRIYEECSIYREVFESLFLNGHSEQHKDVKNDCMAFDSYGIDNSLNEVTQQVWSDDVNSGDNYNTNNLDCPSDRNQRAPVAENLSLFFDRYRCELYDLIRPLLQEADDSSDSSSSSSSKDKMDESVLDSIYTIFARENQIGTQVEATTIVGYNGNNLNDTIENKFEYQQITTDHEHCSVRNGSLKHCLDSSNFFSKIKMLFETNNKCAEPVDTCLDLSFAIKVLLVANLVGIMYLICLCQLA